MTIYPQMKQIRNLKIEMAPTNEIIGVLRIYIFSINKKKAKSEMKHLGAAK